MTTDQGRPSTTPAEPVESRPWQPQAGPRPRVWCWPPGDRPALYVWSAGDWRYAPILARHSYGNGRTVYQVSFDPAESTLIIIRSYAWPQPGLRVAHPSGSTPTEPFATSAREINPRVGRRSSSSRDGGH